ncbi:MAG TPA: hypothetical protein VJK54_01510 [Chthoniobacterales bacterium]|nr:hypothetical protein [Chthoniobacterales bacterium]
MKTNLSILSIFLSVLFSSSISLFAQMNREIMKIEERATDFLISGSSDVTAIPHGVEERLRVANTEAVHGAQENIKPLSKPAYADEGQGVDATTKLFAAEGEFGKSSIARITTKIEEAKQASNEKLGGENSYLWDHIAVKLEQSRDSWNKVSELIAQGKPERASLWRKAAEESETSAEGVRKAIQAYIAEKQNEGNSWYWASESLQSQANYQVKECEAQEVGKTVLALGYREAAAVLQCAADQYKQAALAFAEEKVDEGYNYYLVGDYLRSKAEHQAGVAEKTEEESGENVIKQISTITPGIIKAGGNLYPEFISTKRKMDRLMKEKALFVYCEKWLVEGGSVYLSNCAINVIHTLKKSADYELIRSYEKYRNNVRKAHELGNNFLALSLIQVAEDIQQAIEDSIQQAKNDNEKLLYVNWLGNVVQAGQKLAAYRDRYIQISVSFQPPEIVSGWKKMVERSESSVNYYRKAAEARALSNAQECDRFYRAAHSMNSSVKKLENVVIALEKSFSMPIKPEVTVLWRKAAEQYQISAEFDAKAAEEKAQGNRKESVTTTADYYSSVEWYYESSANRFKGAAIAHEKATQASARNQGELATLLMKASKQYEKLAEYNKERANAKISGNTTESLASTRAMVNHLNSGNEFDKALISHEKATQAIAVNQEELATLLLKKVKQHEELADYYRDIANVEMPENTIDYYCFSRAERMYKDSADQFEKALTAHEEAARALAKNRGELATLLMKVSKQHEKSAEYYQKAANAKIGGNTTECDCLSKAGWDCQKSADELEEAAFVLKWL